MLAGATLRSKLARKLTYKKLVVFLSLCSIVVIVGGVLVGLDYLNYKHGSQSHLFATLDTYQQNQTLHLYNLDLKVTSVKVTPYDEAKLVADEQRCIDNNSHYKSIFNSSFIDNLNNTSLCTRHGPENDASAFAQKYKRIEVGFYYQNLSDQPIEFNEHNFQLLANTGLYNEWKCSPQSEQAIKGSGLGACVQEDISKAYSGPLNLEIKLYGKTKRIVINN